MEKKLVVYRNMNKELKISSKFRSKDYVKEKHFATVPNVKQVRFLPTAPHKHYDNPKKPFPNTLSLSNEDYIYANAQIWINKKNSSSEINYYDIYSQWESIIQINFYISEEVVCPICLDSPKICRTDRCGHVYCYPCLNKFLSYENGYYKKCALCNQHINRERLKRASFIPRFKLKVNDTLSFLLMKRNKNESFSTPICVNQIQLPSAYSDNSRFSNIAVCDNEDLKSIIQIEILLLEDMLADAIREDSDRINSIAQALESIRSELKETSNFKDSANFSNSECIPVENIEQLKEIMQIDNVYYQAEDGCNFFMCPLNWKCLTKEFLDNNICLPLRISGQILEIEQFVVTHDFINRYRYLKYLPYGSTVYFVEIDLSNFLSEKTLQTFNREIQRKNENRNMKEKLDQVLTKEKIKHENSFNSSTGFICLNSLMTETDNILDSDFVPLCAAITPTSPFEKKEEKRKSFADMISIKKTHPIVQQNNLMDFMKSTEVSETQTRGFSLQDCVVRKSSKKLKK